MIIDRIYEWAHSQPNKAAIIQNASTINYAAYARAIESARKFLARQQLPQGTTAGLLISNLSNCWIVSIAMRAIGLNTIAVPSVVQAQQLQVRDLSCFVVMEKELGARDLATPESTTARPIVVPTAIFADIHQGDPPAPLNMNSLYGGHILYTSGTTGTNKKIFMSSDLEDERNARRAEILPIDAGTISNGLYFHFGPAAATNSHWQLGIKGYASFSTRVKIGRKIFSSSESPASIWFLIKSRRCSLRGRRRAWATVNQAIALSLFQVGFFRLNLRNASFVN